MEKLNLQTGPKASAVVTSSATVPRHSANIEQNMKARKKIFPRLRCCKGKFRLFGHFIHAQFILLALMESSAFAAAIYYSLTLLAPAVADQPLDWVSPRIALIVAVFIFSISAMGLYDVRQREKFVGILSRLIAAFFFSTLLLAALYLFFPLSSLGEGLLIPFVLASFAGAGVVRAVFYKYIDGNVLLRRILVIGTGKRARFIDQLRRKSDVRGFDLIGFIPPKTCQHIYVNPQRILTLGDEFCDFALENDIDEIVIALDDRRQGLPTDELLNCRMSGIDVTDMLDFFEREREMIQLDLLQPGWLIHAAGFKRNFFRSAAKRISDIAISAFLIIVSSPLMLLTALAILIESGGKGPVFYHQKRVGRNGKDFNLFKFRSMQTDAEKDGKARWAEENDSRITRVGAVIRKYRLDELPQLWNVLIDDMSLVGPRPERPEFVGKLCEINALYTERHRVNPGIAGWAQLCYPYGASEKDSIEKLQYDLYYVKNHGVLFDFYILVQTAEVVLFGKGAR